jgi:hypothetical protein
MQQNQEPTTLLRIGTMTAVAGGGLLALIWLIIFSCPEAYTKARIVVNFRSFDTICGEPVR